MVDPDGRIVLVNREIERLFGYAREELLGRSVDMLVPDSVRERHGGFRDAFLREPRVRAMGAGRDLHGLRKDGTRVPVEIGLTPVATEEGMFILSAVVDISARQQEEAERRKLENQVRHTQKLEAVGTLAGGVAHDFNNILSAILGYAELLEDHIGDAQARSDLDELKQFVKRGRTLVKRIQAFSRRQEAERVPLSLDRLVEEVTSFLRSSVGPDIRIETRLRPDAPRILADPSAMHQVLMNFGLNAAHAMPEGGRLTVEVEPVYVTDSKARRHPGLKEGLHTLLSVTDTGTGIPEEVRERVFEPFFTTKEPGSGSGLGLAIVHGIITEHGGAVELESVEGEGTVARAYFPAVDRTVPETGPEAETPRGRGERVLYVDDEPAIARVGQRRLESLGYRVTVAHDGASALEAFRAAPDEFDVVVTDYLMPGMSGLGFAQHVRELRADLPILLLTGFVDNLPDAEIRARGVGDVLMKPATLDQLASSLRRLLDRSAF